MCALRLYWLVLPVLGGRGPRLPGVSMVQWVCTDWRCSSLSLAGFLLVLTAFCCTALSFASLLGFNYWFMYLSICGDQSLISNWRWGSRHVYIAIFSVLILHYCVCVCFLLFLALLLLFWSKLTLLLALPSEFPNSVSNPYTTYRKTGCSAQWYANRLVLGTMVRKPFGSWHDGAWTVVFWLDLTLFNLTCFFWLVFACFSSCACFA